MRFFTFFVAGFLALCIVINPLYAQERAADHQLVMACSFGDLDRVKKAVDAGADVNAPGADNTIPIMWASERGFPEIVQLLLSRGARINAQNGSGLTALMLAVRSNRTEVVKILIASNADKTLKDKLGNTAAKWATMVGNKEVLKILGEPN